MAGATDRDLVRFLAAWALVHETADEAWKAAVARGQSAGPEGIATGPDAFVDGLSAMIAAEKERLKDSLASADDALSQAGAGPGDPQMEEVRFELGEMRSRLEAIETALDNILRRLDSGQGPGR